ncbi:MAG: serine/threonine protein kinase, partial [Myxococcales bacterium]|nr:serine/threonine protein kinase [Myxococcales bacterium]
LPAAVAPQRRGVEVRGTAGPAAAGRGLVRALTGRFASDSDSEHRAAVSGAETIVRGLDSRDLDPAASGRATLIGDTDAPRADATLRRGVVLGRYIVLERIGAGAMGVVYAAYDPELDRKVALKLLRAESSATGSESVGRARLLREAQAMAKVSHPNVVAIHDVGEADVGGHGIVYLAMEFIVGASLFARLEAARVGRPQGHAMVLEWFIAAGRGLAAAHDAGLVHRDFKPENVIVGDDGRVRVLDFGLAHADLVGALVVAEATRGTFNPRLTETGVIMGTPFYMAPEQFAGAEVDARADQFAFCASLYEAVYGERPFHGDSLASLARAVTQGVVRPPSHRQVSGGLRRALLRGLAPRREDRWPSMYALLAALERLSSRRVVGTLAAVGVAVVGASVGLGLWLRDDPCAQASAELAEVWNPSRREAIERRTEDLYGGEELSALAVGALDAYARAWSDQRQEACLATRTRGTASEASLELRYACLDRARVRFDGALTALVDETTSAELLRRAPELVAGLGDLSECEDLERLRAQVAPPRGVEATRAVDALRGELVASSTRAAAGQTAGIAAEFEAHVATAREIGYRPMLAEALGMLGHSYVFTSRVDEARVALDEGLLIAEAEGDDVSIVKLLREIGILEARNARFDVAEQHFHRAFAVLERMGSDDAATVAALHVAWARVKVLSRDLEGGLREVDAAITAMHGRDPDDIALLSARSMRADLLSRDASRSGATD